MYTQECQKNFFWDPHLYNFLTAYLMPGKEFQYKFPYNWRKYQLTNPWSYMLPVQECSTEDTKLAVLTAEGIAGGLATPSLAVSCASVQNAAFRMCHQHLLLSAWGPRILWLWDSLKLAFRLSHGCRIPTTCRCYKPVVSFSTHHPQIREIFRSSLVTKPEK